MNEGCHPKTPHKDHRKDSTGSFVSERIVVRIPVVP
jgi:hypothetical protein